MPTIEDVAKASGVSRGTVSRVLNHGSVSPHKKLAVLEAIEKLGYKPNIAAQSLRSSKTNLVGLLVPTFSGGFFGEVMQVLQDDLMPENKTLIVVEGRNSESELKAIQHLISMRCDGLILDPRYLTDHEIISIINKSGIPTIILDRLIPDISESCVYYDHYGAAKQLTEYLIDKGHKNILCLAGLSNRKNASLRQSGFVDAMKANELKPTVVNGQYIREVGYDAIKQVFTTKTMPSAIICCSEIIAAGVIQASSEIGLHIPQQLELVSFDSYGLCQLLTPVIPSIQFPIIEMSLTASEKLRELINGKKNIKGQMFSPLGVV